MDLPTGDRLGRVGPPGVAQPRLARAGPASRAPAGQWAARLGVGRAGTAAVGGAPVGRCGALTLQPCGSFNSTVPLVVAYLVFCVVFGRLRGWRFAVLCPVGISFVLCLYLVYFLLFLFIFCIFSVYKSCASAGGRPPDTLCLRQGTKKMHMC